MKAVGAGVLVALAMGASASSICSSSYCYAGAQFNSANKISSTQAINGVAPCFQSVAGGIACYAYAGGEGLCPFPGMVDCGSNGSGSSTTGPTISPASKTPIATSSKVPVASTTPTSTQPKSSTAKPSTTQSTPDSTSNGSKKSGSSSSQSNTANNNASSPDASSSHGTWPYFVGGGAALLLIGVIVIILVKKSRNGDDDDEIEDHIYQSQHRSGKHSMQSVSGTHLSPYDMKQTHTYDVEMGYQPTLGYQDPRCAPAAKATYAPQAIPMQQAPPSYHTRGDMHLLPDAKDDDERHSVTF